MNSDYVFHSRWHVPLSRDALWDEVEQLLASDDPMAWWESVEVTHYDGQNLAARAASHFGYRLAFQLTHLKLTRPTHLSFDSEGDLRGSGKVTFVDGDDGSSSYMDIDWRVATDRRWMRWTGWLLRPVFVAGHHMIMRQGEKNLNAWLTLNR
jgi:hypothetical protein